MKTTLKILGGVVALFSVFLLYVQFTYKQEFTAPLTGITASTDSATIARGKYLVTGPAHCWTCHVPHSQGLQSPDSAMKGGVIIELPFGKIYTPNITSDNETGIGTYSDEDIARALRYSVKHDRRALIPFMTYNTMSDEDLAAVISYLRTTEPVKNRVPNHELTMLGKVVSRFLLKPITPEQRAPQQVKRDSSAAYGKYLAYSVTNCNGCHTERDKKTGAFAGEPFAGGHQMKGEEGVFTTPNLTPHSTTGIVTNWSADQFVRRFRMGPMYKDSPMPWKSYEKMSDEDLKSLYYFLKSLDPIENKVQVYTKNAE